MSKIIEKFVAKQLYEFISVNGISYDYQFGFQPSIHSPPPLTYRWLYILKAFNNTKYIIAVFLDFQKAFDLVDHKSLQLRDIGVETKHWKGLNTTYLTENNL